MENEVAIKVTNVSKSFKLPHDKQNSIKGGLISLVKNGKRTYEKQEVLKDISFEIKKGEFFGIVGRNGSGKSTLLKMLAGIYTPTNGNIHVNGSLTPFIELGVGFNPELTGRENVYLNGALLGFNRSQMDEMYAEIVDFAELERFMDQKLKNYSSGMQVRLAFSIAIRAQGDILLLDEVLAVGDEAFQKKCYDYFDSLKRNKKTVILVTHDMSAVEKFCTKAMLIENGEIVTISNPRDVAKEYTKKNNENYEHKPIDHRASSGITIETSKTSYKRADSASVDIKWTKNNIDHIGFALCRQNGECMYSSSTKNDKYDLRGKKSITHSFELPIGAGEYFTQVGLYDANGEVIEFESNGPFISIKDEHDANCLVDLSHSWE